MMIMRVNYPGVIVGAVFLLALLVRAQKPVPECGANSGVDFRIVTDKLVYAPKSMVRVKFLITNTGEKPLYLDRGLSFCTSPMGFYWLIILDKHNKRMPVNGCSADVVMEKVDAVAMLTSPKTGIALTPGEVFGREGEFQLPTKRGTYRLKAELFTGGFFPKQLQTLAENHMRALQSLQCKIEAPVVTVTVK